MYTYGMITEDFFKHNPEWLHLESSKRLINSFNEDIASNVRWVVYLLLDSSSPYFKSNNIEKRYGLVLSYIENQGVLNKEDFVFDEDLNEVKSDKFGFVFDSYPRETMSRKKRDYFERERAYSHALIQESELDDVSDRLKAQKDLSIVSTKLNDLYEEIEEEENKTKDISRTRGSQQIGSMFRKK